MSFKLTNASAIFQTYINQILKHLINIICMIYLNDILIYFFNQRQHIYDVIIILKKL